MYVEEARAIVAEAASEGLLRAEAVWDLAWAARGGEVALDSALSDLVGTHRLQALRARA